MAFLRLVLAWVCDPAFGQAYLPSRDEDARYWNTLGSCIETANQLRARVGEDGGLSLRFTWLVRCDAHIASLHGDSAWCLRRFSGMWSRLQAQGDSLGWVFYPTVQEGRRWAQIYTDGARPTELLSEAGSAYQAAGEFPDALLMGWHGHTQGTMKQAAEVGVAVDLSAIPGWYSIKRAGIVPPVGACDWEITPIAPYYPSALDYRRPIVYPKEPAENILELPWTLGPAPLHHFQEGLVDLLRPGSLGLRRNYRRRRQGIPIKIGLDLAEFKRLVTPTLAKAERATTILTILCQTSELKRYGPNGLDIIQANLVWLLKECKARGLSFDALPAREARELLTPRDCSKPILPEQHATQQSAHQH